MGCPFAIQPSVGVDALATLLDEVTERDAVARLRQRHVPLRRQHVVRREIREETDRDLHDAKPS